MVAFIALAIPADFWLRKAPILRSLSLTLNQRRYHLAVACFHPLPQRGLPGGTARVPIGLPVERPAEMWPPPMKPRPEWSKLSLLKSSMIEPKAPAAMNGLVSLSSKKTVTPEPVYL